MPLRFIAFGRFEVFWFFGFLFFCCGFGGLLAVASFLVFLCLNWRFGYAPRALAFP